MWLSREWMWYRAANAHVRQDVRNPCGGILNGLQHVLAEMSHLGRFGIQANGIPTHTAASQAPQTDCKDSNRRAHCGLGRSETKESEYSVPCT